MREKVAPGTSFQCRCLPVASVTGPLVFSLRRVLLDLIAQDRQLLQSHGGNLFGLRKLGCFLLEVERSLPSMDWAVRAKFPQSCRGIHVFLRNEARQ